VIRGEIKAEVIGTGTLESRIQTVISSWISGKTVEFFLIGDRELKKGKC